MASSQELLLGTGTAVNQYQIQRSLRFNSADSAYLNRTPASAGNRRTFTISFWMKRSRLGATQYITEGGSPDGATTRFMVRMIDSEELSIDNGTTSYFRTTALYRDPSAWYHIVVAFDTTAATQSNRYKIYVNGSQVTAGTNNYPNQNDDTGWNMAQAHSIGRSHIDSGGYFGGYITEFYNIDGQQLTPSSFGETDTDTGVWKPKAYSGSYGTNGFYLNFSDNSGTTSTTLGKDYSGNGNNWTPNNFSVTAGAGNDSLVDTPTPYGTDTGAGGEVRGNYATWNPISGYSITLTNGNLDYTTGTSANPVTSTWSLPTSGKWYWEVTVSSVGEAMIGIQTRNNLAYAGPKTAYYRQGGASNSIFIEGSANAYNASSYTNGDVIGVAYNADSSQISWYKNNVQQGGPYTLTSLENLTPIIIQASGSGSNSGSANFGQRPFAYTAPSGFKALCTQNLPTPSIGATSATQAGKYFNTVLYTGDGATTQAVTGVGFTPDWTWIKRRSDVTQHVLTDVVRGTGKSLSSSSSAAEVTNEPLGYLTSFDSDGFTVNRGSGNLGERVNASGATFVGWNWKANGSGSSNTQGTITSTVSANTTAGFSVVTYTGNNTLAQSVGHGLGAAPSMIIVKSRSNATNWLVWHSTISINSTLLLNDTSAEITGLTGIWGSALPTSTTFGLNRLDTDNNRNGQTYVAYCFAPVAGYSAFGSYTGNGSSDGPFVYTGFRPAYVMIKYSSGTADWIVLDKSRPGYNVIGGNLYPNGTYAEDTQTKLDFTSNGFKIRADGTNANVNVSSGTYIYAAFAEFPFKYTLAR